MFTPVARIFIGTSAGGEDAEAAMVCEHSIRSRASCAVNIEWLVLSSHKRDVCGGWHTSQWSTPWTGFRWAVPAMCGWDGRGIYLDCTTIVLGDVAELARAPMPMGACVMTRRNGASIHTGCMVFDCEAAKKKLPTLPTLKADPSAHQSVGRILATHEDFMCPLPAGWGMRDPDYSNDVAAVTGSVHYALPQMWPHLRPADRRLILAGRRHWFQKIRLPHYCAGLRELFDRELLAAQSAGYSVEKYVPGEPWDDYAIAGAERKERA